MSYFTVSLSEVMQRMRNESGTTMQQFAARLGMPLSTFSAYYTGKNRPTPEAVEKIASGMSEDDARQVIVAHINDEIPTDWREKLAIGDAVRVAEGDAFRLSDFGALPKDFVQLMNALMREARQNEHLIGMVRELCSLLGLEAGAEDAKGGGSKEVAECLNTMVRKAPVMYPPAGIVRTKRSGRPSSSTPEQEAPEEAEEGKDGPASSVKRGSRRSVS